MTVLTIFIILIIGIIMLGLGFATNKKWLKSLSIIPIALSFFQLLELLSMNF
jgi:hypothetical protein